MGFGAYHYINLAAKFTGTHILVCEEWIRGPWALQSELTGDPFLPHYDKGGNYQKLSQGSETLDMTSEGTGEDV